MSRAERSNNFREEGRHKATKRNFVFCWVVVLVWFLFIPGFRHVIDEEPQAGDADVAEARYNMGQTRKNSA